MSIRVISTLACASAAVAGMVVAPATAAPSRPSPMRACDLLAARTGSDHASGAVRSPFRTAQRLADALRPGKVGCLAAGQTFVGDLTLRRPGRRSAPITLTSAPGRAATLRGRIWLSNSADDVTLRGLRLDGRNARGLPSPTVNSDRARFVANDVTNHHTGICFSIGSVAHWGTAHDTQIVGNTIHDCGRLPATNHDHGIYVESARRTLISDNIISNNADRGIQLYPDAQSTVITRNIIDRNGEGIIFSGEGSHTSNGNVVTRNIISNSRLRYNIEAYWGNPGLIGRGNVVRDNCVWNGAHGELDRSGGYKVSGRLLVVDPRYVSSRGGRARLHPKSRCRDYAPRSGAGLGASVKPAVVPHRGGR